MWFYSTEYARLVTENFQLNGSRGAFDISIPFAIFNDNWRHTDVNFTENISTISTGPRCATSRESLPIKIYCTRSATYGTIARIVNLLVKFKRVIECKKYGNVESYEMLLRFYWRKLVFHEEAGFRFNDILRLFMEYHW